ncbi:hypothetical protein Tco_1140486, partial [Tanacetum coccineum]
MMEKLVIRENRQRVLVRKRIERIGENKNRKRAVWNKNRQSDLVSKRIEINVNAARHKLNTAGINLLQLLKVNAVRHNLLLLVKVNVVKEQFWSTVKAKAVNGEVQLHALVDGKKIIITESTVRRDLQLEDTEGVDYEAVYKELDDSLVMGATIASSLEAEHDSGNIVKTRSKATPNEAGSQGTTSGGGPCDNHNLS